MCSVYPSLGVSVISSYCHAHRDEPTSGDDQDFVFEEFVRLRVAGVDEPGANETEA